MEQALLKKDFSIKESISEGWKIMRANMGILLAIQGVIFLWYIVANLPAFFETPTTSLTFKILDRVLPAFVGWMISLGYVNIALKLSRYESVSIKDLFAPAPLLWRYFLSNMGYTFAVLIGLICFIVPGLIILIRFSLSTYVLVDKNRGPLTILENSWDIIKGCTWKFFFFAIVLTLMNMAGFLCLFIGLLFTAPASVIAMAIVYRKLDSQTLERPACENLRQQ